ncbi:MAG: tetratricopeptide repeat protein, partial [Acidobacteriota bacterium]
VMGDLFDGSAAARERWMLLALAVFASVLSRNHRTGTSTADVAEAEAALYVAVPITAVAETAVRAEQLAAKAIHTAVLQGLIDRRGLIPVEVPPDAPSATADLARELAVEEVFTSSLLCDAGRCSAGLRRVDRTGAVLWAHSFSADPEKPLSLGEAVLGHLGAAYPDAATRPGAAALEVRPEDYERYLDLAARFEGRDGGLSAAQLLDELDEIVASSPRFVAAPLLQAHVALQRHQGSRDPGDEERARVAVDRALAVAPRNPRVLLLAARAARQAEDWSTAESRLAEVKRLEPGHSSADFQLALIAEQRGDVEGAAEILRRLAARHPSVYHLFNSA